MAKTLKTRNNQTMTESGFWSWIRSALRTKSMQWKPISEIKKLNRRPYNGSNKRQKWEYKCSCCKQYYSSKEIEVDHIEACGSFNKDTAGEFIKRLFCEIDGLQILCKPCHKNKTKETK